MGPSYCRSGLGGRVDSRHERRRTFRRVRAACFLFGFFWYVLPLSKHGRRGVSGPLGWFLKILDDWGGCRVNRYFKAGSVWSGLLPRGEEGYLAGDSGLGVIGGFVVQGAQYFCGVLWRVLQFCRMLGWIFGEGCKKRLVSRFEQILASFLAPVRWGAHAPYVYFGYLLCSLLSARDWVRVAFLSGGFWAFHRGCHVPVFRCKVISTLLGLICSSYIDADQRSLILLFMWEYPAYPMEEAMEVDASLDHLNPAAYEGKRMHEGDIEVHVAFNELFAFDENPEELLAQETGRIPPRLSRQMFHCPVTGCSRSVGAGGAGWNNQDAVRAHVDLHLAGDLRGSPPAKWLADRNLGICRGCHRSASLRFHGGVHSRCWRRLQGQDLVEARLDLAGDERIPLPSIEEIFCTHISTKESLPSSLIALAREEYGKCLARVLESSCDHAWDVSGGDSVKKQ